MEYYIQGSRERAEEIKAEFEAKGCTLYRLISNCNSEDLIYYSLKGMVRAIKKDNLYLFEGHPGYKELKLSTKPQFKEGDWVIVKNGGDFHNGNYTEQITLIEDDGKHKRIWLSSKSWVDDDYIRLWTIKDAKDGDVLVSRSNNPFVYNGNIEYSSAGAYVGVSQNGKIILDMFPSKGWTNIKDIKPATKEQRDLLFNKLKEIGYQWDAEKKELRKIKQHYDISNFHAGMPVLVRDSYEHKWLYTIFGNYDKHNSVYPFVVVDMRGYEQCIPFEDNEHLLGTTGPCGEEYINW